MHIFLANVGANTGPEHRRLVSPLFDDGTFEFLPIPEGDRNLDKNTSAVHCRDLRSHREPNRDLRRYVPEHLWNAACHNDPDLNSFTYGDACDKPRASNLKDMESGDVLLFIARLVPRWVARSPASTLSVG